MAPHRHWIAPALYMALILALSSIPGSTGPDTVPGPAAWIPPIVSNTLHVPVYAGLGFLWARALTLGTRLRLRDATLTALVIAAVFGGIDELYQGLIPGRTTALGDWVADATGAIFGCLVFMRWRYREPRSR